MIYIKETVKDVTKRMFTAILVMIENNQKQLKCLKMGLVK